MEFHEKLQELRKSRGLTQEELAADLYVSRAAVSKWESGRGYPGIDSLKEISAYFSVSIDELLSGDRLLNIAEKENKEGIKKLCHMLFSFCDLFALLLIFLPLYPKTFESFVYSVNLIAYSETTAFNRGVYWIIFSALILCGVLKLFLTKSRGALTYLSMALGIIAVLFLAMAGESYAVVTAFMLLAVKTALILKCAK